MSFAKETTEQTENTRRTLLRNAGLAAGAVLVAGNAKTAFAQAMPADKGMPPSSPPGPGMATIPGSAVFGSLATLSSDVDILNFALTLEYLEADFYNRVVEANAARPYLRGRIPAIAAKLAADENAHVAAIVPMISELGGTPIPKPTFQFPAEAFISSVAFLDLAAQLEGTGVGAYLGAAPKVKSARVLKFAASIYGIEARHTGLIRFVAGYPPVETPQEVPLSADEIATRIAPMILSGAPATTMPAMTMENGQMMPAAPAPAATM